MTEPENISITHGAVEMNAIALGSGPPVMLVHGFPQSHRTWMRNLKPLAARYRVMAMDLPGFGASTKIALESLEEFGAYLVRLLDKEGLEAAHMVGHSFGGLVVLRFALDHPDRVRSLSLVDPSGLAPTATDFREKFARARTQEEIREMYTFVFHDPDRFKDVIDMAVEGQAAYKAQPGVLDLVAELNDKTEAWISAVEPRVDEIKAPLLVMWGKEDRATSPANAARVSGLPNAEVHLFEGAGHAPQVEVAETFNEKLLSFLDSQSDGQGRL